MTDLSKNIEKEILKYMQEQTMRYIPNSPLEGGDSEDDEDVDFPYVEDPTDFVTYRHLEQSEELEEQAPEEPAGAEPAVEPDPTTAASPEEIGADVGAEVGAGMGAEVGTGMGGFGMGEPEEKLTSTEIGRVYELKKIFSRLSSIESYLIRTTDPEILELRKYVANAIGLFEIVISNFTQFKDKIDDIIIVFYEFLDTVYSSLKKYFSGKGEK